MNTPQLLYLSNCGIYFTCGKTRILLDGLQSDSSPFDRLPKTLESLIIDGDEPYGHIDFLVYTHLHFDHFDLDKTLRLMKNHPETTLVIPHNFTEALVSAENGLRQKADAVLRSRTVLMEDTASGGRKAAPVQKDYSVMKDCTVIKNCTVQKNDAAQIGEAEIGGLSSLSTGDVTVTWLRVNHITFDYPQHYCLLLSCCAGDFLFTADMDFEQLGYVAEAFDLCRRPRLTAFFNPILLGKQKWVEEAARWQPEKVYIYHIPAEATDSNGYRKMAQNRALRYEVLLPQMELLLNPVQPLENGLGM